ncbi:unnamed protein product, partial [Mesorhabditis spiculigera]
MPFDFGALPLENQFEILRYMDLQSFFKTAISSKSMLQLAQRCPNKRWKCDIMHRARKGDFEFWRHPSPGPLPNNYKAMQLLFHNSTVDGLNPDTLPHEEINIRCQRLWLNLNRSEPYDILPYLKRHKPLFGKYKWVSALRQFPPSRETLDFLNASTDAVSATLCAPLSAYIHLKVTGMILDAPMDSGESLAANTEVLIREWLRGERQISPLIELRSFDTELNPIHPVFFTRHPKLYVAKGDTTYYRVRRNDGKVMIARFSLSRWSISIAPPEYAKFWESPDNAEFYKFLFGAE